MEKPRKKKKTDGFKEIDKFLGKEGKKKEEEKGWEKVDARLEKMIETVDMRKQLDRQEEKCPSCKCLYILVQDRFPHTKKITFLCPSCKKPIKMNLSTGYWGVFGIKDIGGVGLKPHGSQISISDSSKLRKGRGIGDDIVKFKEDQEKLGKEAANRYKKEMEEKEEYEETHKDEISIEQVIVDLLREKKISLENKKKLKKSIKTTIKELEKKGVNLDEKDAEYILKSLKSSLMKKFDEL